MMVCNDFNDFNDFNEWSRNIERDHYSRTTPNFDMSNKERVHSKQANHPSPSTPKESHSTFDEDVLLNRQGRMEYQSGSDNNEIPHYFKSPSSRVKSPSIREEDDVFIIEDVEESEDDTSQSLFQVGLYSKQKKNDNNEYELDYEEIEEIEEIENDKHSNNHHNHHGDTQSFSSSSSILDFDLTTTSSSSSSSPTIASLLLLPILLLCILFF